MKHDRKDWTTRRETTKERKKYDDEQKTQRTVLFQAAEVYKYWIVES